MAFVTDADIKQYFADHTAQSAYGNLEPRYDRLITRANTAAYNLILTTLGSRGYTAAQIAAWDQGAEFNLDLACCYLLPSVKGGDDDGIWRERFCRKDELAEIAVLVSGEVVDPASSQAAVSYGDMSRSDDAYSRDTEW
jgi:hypothetical protein